MQESFSVNQFLPRSANFWKISHGSSIFNKDACEKLEKERILVVAGDTGRLTFQKATQGDNFRFVLKKGDYFYLCNGSNVRLLGQISSDECTESPTKTDGISADTL